MNVLVIPSWYPNGTDKLMGIYHKEFCEALSKHKDINVNMLYIDRQRLNAPVKYIFMKKKDFYRRKEKCLISIKLIMIGKSKDIVKY